MKSNEKCVELIIYSLFVALIGALLIGVPQSFAQNAESSPSEPLRLTVAPHASSRIAMKTMPKATCVLHVDGDSDASHSLRLLSDDEGMIRFNVNPSEESDEVASYAVDCASDGQSRTFGLELRASTMPTLDMPAPGTEIRRPRASDIIRPAMTRAEALQLPDEEVIKREYPVRPNPNDAPDALAAWLQVVTKPARRVEPRQVADPEARASTWELLSNWSGFALKNAPNEDPVPTYDLVEGEWTVPAVPQSKVEQNKTTQSFFWIGLDGDSVISSDLWQAGTEQNVTNLTFLSIWGGLLSENFSTYSVWSEFLPGQSTAQVLANFNVSPGDTIFSEVYVANAGESPSLSGLFATAFIENVTKGEYTWVYNCRGITFSSIGCWVADQTAILGYQAEWIMERPSVKGTLTDLTDYNQAWMYYPYAMTTSGTLVPYNAANSLDIWMYNSSTGDLLSAPYVWNNNAIQYIWYNFH